MRSLGALIALFGLVLGGCSPKEEGKSSPEQSASGRAGKPAPMTQPAIDACAAVATLYPKERMSDTTTRDAVVGKLWAHRDGGLGSPHGPPEKWRRNTDLRFEPAGDVIEMTYEETVESTNEAPSTTKLDKDCQICGEVLVCEQQVWALATRTNNPPKGSPLDLLDSAAILELGDDDLYLIRHGHEVHLGFGADPRTNESGSLEIRVRKLEAGAKVVTESTTFTSEEMAAGYAGRTVKIELPGADGIRIEYRPERGPGGAGYGTDTTIRSSLFEMESLKRNPQLMKQPKSLEIAEDAAGFQHAAQVESPSHPGQPQALNAQHPARSLPGAINGDWDAYACCCTERDSRDSKLATSCRFSVEREGFRGVGGEGLCSGGELSGAEWGWVLATVGNDSRAVPCPRFAGKSNPTQGPSRSSRSSSRLS